MKLSPLPCCVDGGIKKTFAKTIAFCLNLCYNIHRKRAPMSVAPLISWLRNKPPKFGRRGGYFFLFFSIFYYKIGKSDKYEYHRKKFIPRYVVHTTTSPRVSKGVKSFIRSLLLRLKGSNRHRLVLLPLYAAFSLYCNARILSISKSRASGG